ncbi:MAG: class I SAM-dependent methyltransferase [Sedimentitalea sp.]
MSKPDLDSAYNLQTPEDSKRLYADWADNYDETFAASSNYRLHIAAAQAFVAAGGSGPVLDVGAGTGLCGVALAELGAKPIDATDISPEMLDQAALKNIYRATILGDLTATLPMDDNSYNGIVSSGTFTTGHVGPDALGEVLRVARQGAVCALSVNAKHYASAGFQSAFETLSNGAITGLTLLETRIYHTAATGDHKDDVALIACFTKA